MEKTPLKSAVPTTTLIIAYENKPEMVIVFDSNEKHNGKKVLPGGRVKVGHQDWLEAGLKEAEEEVGITDLKNIRSFALCSKVGRDVRNVSLERYLDGAPIPTGINQNEIEIEAHYGFDVVLVATTNSQPEPDGIETSNAYFVNVYDVDPNDYALDHGEILVAYANYLDTGELPALGQF